MPVGAPAMIGAKPVKRGVCRSLRNRKSVGPATRKSMPFLVTKYPYPLTLATRTTSAAGPGT